MIRRRSVLGSLAGAAALAAPALRAQEDKSPISIVIGTGASIDVAARLIGEQIKDVLGRTVLVIQKFGAGQRIAVGEVRRAAPDGRTLLFCTNGPFAIYPNIYNKLEYNPATDFTPIAGISSFDVGIATGPATGATDLKQLVEWCRTRNKGELVFASAPGNGSLSHFVGLSLGLATGLRCTHVPYKDSGPGVLDLAEGRVPAMITGTNSFVEMHKAGRVRILAVSGEQRSPRLPDVPTLKEAGINLSSATVTGLFGPANLPPEFTRRMYEAIAPLYGSPVFRERLALQTMAVWPATGPQLAASLAEERKRFDLLVKTTGYHKEDA
ncbi:tripartite tricarboxylate transporter substrate-binding protein [Ramlibacter sp.]|uniref:tripartite tricarboxylate transporter substrate-binding protein n=1 Tax=Ramlibacter sp. TaxID=1917967 RepID=UPI002617A495|nr:tripartite tricarboxylate transporter substrate-binding protein [Ramlibacter sp.]MDB5958367.1 transporter substrate-binding protein [Ramlibacter sp.]